MTAKLRQNLRVFGREHELSRTEFCVSCHSQTFPYEKLKKSSHDGALGADLGCKDCHVPQGLGSFDLALWTHTYDGIRALLAEMKYGAEGYKRAKKRRRTSSVNLFRSTVIVRWPNLLGGFRKCRLTFLCKGGRK